MGDKRFQIIPVFRREKRHFEYSFVRLSSRTMHLLYFGLVSFRRNEDEESAIEANDGS